MQQIWRRCAGKIGSVQPATDPDHPGRVSTLILIEKTGCRAERGTGKPGLIVTTASLWPENRHKGNAA
jgi:hypothetical protein